jgi:hypothetical protein
LTPAEVRELINAALLKFMMLVDDVTNWYPPNQTPTIKLDQIVPSLEGDAIEEETSREIEESNKAGPIIGAAAGALALLLLLILLVRRNRRHQDDEEVSHLKLQDDGDTTFIQELASDDGTPERRYLSRGAHVVGENDSIFSDWTGYSGKRPKDGTSGRNRNNGRLGHIATDVHHCASATCEVCERQRQQGVKFVAAGTPPRTGSLPKNASRDYSAEDTVSL